MLTLEKIKLLLIDRNLKKVAEKTGLSYDSLRKIAKGQTENPSYAHVKKLSDYLEGKTNG